MREHIGDERPEIFSLDELEFGKTYDELWNASQREMVLTGEMHNYVRMLWGKLVIQQTRNYEEAFAVLEHLNNKYCLDGRNPDCYAGILWCFGKHNRPWMVKNEFCSGDEIFLQSLFPNQSIIALKLRLKYFPTSIPIESL